MKYWEYLKTFEEDIKNYSRYVEIAPGNLKVYSLELTRLYLSICSEIDVLLKELCQPISPSKKLKNIDDYRRVIIESFQFLINEPVICSKYNLVFTPFISFNEGKSPEWWVQHNKVKHERIEHYHYANLGNVLESLSALYIINLHLFHEHCKSQSPKEFPPFFEHSVSQLIDRSDMFILHNLTLYINQ